MPGAPRPGGAVTAFLLHPLVAGSSAHGHGLSPRARELASGGTLRTEPSSAGRAASEEPLSSVDGDNTPPPHLRRPGPPGQTHRQSLQVHSPQRLLSECVSRRQSGCEWVCVHVQVTAKHVHRGMLLPSAHPRGHELVVKVQSLEPDCLGSNPGPASYQHTLSYCCLLHASFCVRWNSSLSRTRQCVGRCVQRAGT